MTDRFVTVPIEITSAMVDAALNTRAAWGIGMIPSIKSAWRAMLAAAPHPTPAPASGDVTDAMIEAACIAYINAKPNISIPRMGIAALTWENCGEPWRENARKEMRAALEAATRARKGERKKTCTHCNGAGCPYCHGEGDVYAPNAADEEAYRVVTLEDAKTIREKWDDVFYLSDAATTDEAMLAALQSIGAVIPTAAPVPADEGEKK